MPDKDLNIQLYKKLFLIREAEALIIDHYFEDQMKTPMHMSMGAESIACGIIQALANQDIICGTYRTHALYLAREGDCTKFFAELLGRKDGTAYGKAGSMHLLDPTNGLICTTAIVGTNIPVAIGSAFAAQQKSLNQISVVFFGDGAVDEGVFWESLNFACLKKLPVLFVYEDNGLAVHTTTAQRHGYKSLDNIARQFNCNVIGHYKSNDVEQVYEIARYARDQIISQTKPAWLSFEYYRYLEHVGVLDDCEAGYRSKHEYEEWLIKDPIILQKNKLKSIIDIDVIHGIEQSIRNLVKCAFEEATCCSFVDTDELYKDVFHE